MPIDLRSPAFENGQFMPKRFTALGPGGGHSPPLRWDNVPGNVRSFALIMDDEDAAGGPKAHWVVYDIPPEFRELPEHLPAKPTLPAGPKEWVHIRQGRNDFGGIGYAGPRPDRERLHHYAFTLYALDAVLHLSPGAGKDELLGAMAGHIIDSGQLRTVFSE
ncbi:MAG TPA: YbhB/YbcL family Raf kinase inhibitor-like protein [Gemmataceae bacterium]